MRIIGYKYDAAIHCVDCAKKRFDDNAGFVSAASVDREGNAVAPIFATDEINRPTACDTCHDEIVGTELCSVDGCTEPATVTDQFGGHYCAEHNFRDACQDLKLWIAELDAKSCLACADYVFGGGGDYYVQPDDPECNHPDFPDPGDKSNPFVQRFVEGLAAVVCPGFAPSLRFVDEGFAIGRRLSGALQDRFGGANRG